MVNNNLSDKQGLNGKFLKDIIGLDESEAEEAAARLKVFLTPEVFNRFNCFIKFVCKDEQFIILLKSYIAHNK